MPLPRTGTVYTETTVHMPVPGLKTPYSLVIVELDGVGVRALVKVTGASPALSRSVTEAAWRCAASRSGLGCRTTAMPSSRRRPHEDPKASASEDRSAARTGASGSRGMRRVAIVGAGMTPFGEHFALGIKDLLPMAFADCARSVDKGLR